MLLEIILAIGFISWFTFSFWFLHKSLEELANPKVKELNHESDNKN